MEVVVKNIFLSFNESEDLLVRKLTRILKVPNGEIIGFKIIKKSLDARKKNAMVWVYTLLVELKNAHVFSNSDVSEPKFIEKLEIVPFQMQNRPVIVGFGPAGMFLGLYLARAKVKPIIIERGKCVEEREKDILEFQKNGKFTSNSHVCFGEGGAGTYSDGKLTTGINDPRIRFCLQEFVNHGAPEQILYEAHPHIGSDNLKNVVRNIRKEIIALGGEVHFETTLIDFKEKDGHIYEAIVKNKDGIQNIRTDDLILAIGHSARDTFKVLYEHNVKMKPKPFSMGVRIEHLQEEVNKSQYGKLYKHPKLPVAEYKLAVHLPNKRTLYSFCMCPGGVVVGSNSEENTIVTNGMSYFKRDLENANSALLVNVNVEDYYHNSPLDGVEFQRKYEQLAYNHQNPYHAPCQLVRDLLNDCPSNKLGHVKPSYRPGVYLTSLKDKLPEFVYESLRLGIPLLQKKYQFFQDEEATLTGVETRSSSPIAIPRDEYGYTNIKGLYPCGEGASYAGGIMSAAIDGLRIADLIKKKYLG